MSDTTQEKIEKMLKKTEVILEAGKKTYQVNVAGVDYEITVTEEYVEKQKQKEENNKDCCAKCAYLKVLNTGKVYAFCKEINKVFLPFGVDTREYCCKRFIRGVAK